MNPKQVGEFIQSLRKQKKLTQNELSEIIGVTDKAVSRWETGEGFPEITILPKLAQVLGVSVDEILNGGYAKVQVKDQKKHITRFKLYALISVLIVICGYLIGLLVTNLTYNIWYGLIPILVLDVGAIILYLIMRTLYIEKCDWNDDEKKTLFQSTFLVYFTLIVTFGLYVPYPLYDIYMKAIAGYTIGILSFGYYLLYALISGAIFAVIGYLIRYVHYSKTYMKPMPRLFGYYLFSVLIVLLTQLTFIFSNLITFQIGLVVFMVFLIAYWIYAMKTQQFKLISIILLIFLVGIGFLSYIAYTRQDTDNFFSWIALVVSIAMLVMTIMSIYKQNIIGFTYYFGWFTIYIISLLTYSYFTIICLLWFIVFVITIYLIDKKQNKIKTP